MTVSTFRKGNDNRASTGCLSQVRGTPLMYTIQNADVGRPITFRASFYAGTSNGRRLGLDTVDIVVSPPEPE